MHEGYENKWDPQYFIIMLGTVSPNNFIYLKPHLFSSPKDGVTALSFASENGHEEVVRLLLQSGAKDLPDKVTTINIT